MKNTEYAVFEPLSEAVFVLRKNGELAWQNARARELLGGDRTGERASDYLTSPLLDMEADSAVGTLRAAGREYTACLARFGILRTVTLLTPEREEPQGTTMLMDSVGTAMSGLLGTLRLALGRLVPMAVQRGDTLARYAAMADKSAHSLTRLTRNLRYLFSGETVKSPVNPAEFDLAERCRELISAVSYLAADTGIAFFSKTEPESLPFVGDAELMDRMVLNLLANAIVHTGRGGRIWLSVKRLERGILLSVEDTGCGMGLAEAGRVFERWYYPRRLTEERAGAGLGLGVVRRIAACHNGTAVIESREGGGTLVAVRLESLDRSALRTPAAAPALDREAVLTELADVLSADAFLEDLEE